MSFGFSSDSVSTLFSSLGRNSGQGNILSTYASIKSGAYYKLVKKYYAEEKTSSKSDAKETKESKAKTKLKADENVKTLNNIRSEADEMMDSADKLLKTGSNSVFSVTKTRNTDGTITEKYDTDKIYDAVKDFASKYNDVIKASGDAEATSIVSAGSSMVKSVSANSKLLSKLGITVDKENKLNVDEEKFKKADMNVAKSLFSGNGSFAYGIKTSAAYMSISAKNEATKTSMYKNDGRRNTDYTYSSVFDTMM